MKTKHITLLFCLLVSGWAFGQTNSALLFNGTTDKAMMPNPFPGGAPTTFTVEWWIKPTTVSDYNQCISSISTGWGSFIWHTTVTGEVYCGTDINTRFTNTNLPAKSVDVGNWQHWAFTFKYGSAKVYKNGILIASKTGMATPKAWTGLYFGYANQPIAGYLDEVRVWSTEQTQAQIQTNMYSNVAPGTTGLLEYYKFDDKATVATDYSGNSKNGAMTGCTYAANDQVFDTALSFNGTTDTGTLPNPFTSTPLAYTIEWWLNPATTVNYNQCIGTGWGTFMFHTDATGQVYVGTDVNNRLTPSNGLGANTLTKGTWQHFAFSFNGGTGGTGKLYKNGTLIASKSGMVNPTAFTGIGLGTATTGADSHINGMIDDIKIWSVARSDNDIASDMYNNPLANTNALEGYWNFNDSKAGVASDSSGKNLSGTLIGCQYVTYIRPRYVTKATNPRPGHGLLLKTNTLNLSWTGPSSYGWDVYVGTTEASVKAATKTSPEYKGRVSVTAYQDLDYALQRGTTIWWRVDAVSPSGDLATGDTWGAIYPTEHLIQLQTDFRSWKYGMFLHLGLETFSSPHVEWVNTNGTTYTPANFNMASTLNCGQWADAAKAAGMKYMVLTTRHHSGFALWPTAENTFDIEISPYKKDIVKQFTDSCRSRGLKVGLYLSIWDRHGQSLAYVKNQLTELLTNYGQIDMLWFDGWGWILGYGTIGWDAVRDHIRSLQPNCIVLENNKELNFFHSDIIAFERNVDGIPQAGKPYSNECMETCGNVETTGGDNGFGNWFYGPGTECGLRSDAFHVSTYNDLQAANCNYLLDVTPDRAGLIPQCQVDQLKRIAKTLGIEPKSQTITFGPLAPVNDNAADIDLTATASSGLEVTYTTSDPSVATIVNGKIHILKAGTVSITAMQNGNADYYPAPMVSQNLVISTATGSRNATQKSFSIHPNPVKDKLYIKSIENVKTIEILNESGKIIKNLSSVKNSMYYDVSDIKPGLYFIQLTTNNGSVGSIKFIKN